MPPKKITQPDRNSDARIVRLARWQSGELPTRTAANMRRGPGSMAPNMSGLGDRSRQDKYGVIPMEIRLLDTETAKDAAKVLDPEAIKGKMAKKADYVGTYYGHRGVIRPEYDMLEPFTLVDTEAYLKQAIKRRLSLIMRNGYTVTSEKSQYSEYIQRRLNIMEYVTKRPMNNMFRDMLFNLSLASNCFLLKIRDEEGAGVPKKKEKGSKVPVAGYQIIPSHQIFPYLEKGVVIKWRRYYDTGLPYVDYSLDEIIHLHWDRKPGHIFGTPRTIAVRDDIFALRRLEENVELLLINHLFPLFHVQVGTEEAPSNYLDNGISEIDMIRTEIETMPKEGVFITDERVTVDVVGAEGKSLDTKEIIVHLKSRVYTGLGVSPVDMGEGDCYDAQTEILTENGWKFHRELDHMRERIATLNPDTGKVEFHLANYKYEGYYSGPMVRIQGDHLDIKVTPKHDMWISPLKGGSWRKVEARNLPGHFRLLESAAFSDTPAQDWFELPEVKADQGRASRPIRCKLEDFASFLGYFISEGCLDTCHEREGRYRTVLSQNVGPKLDRMIEDCRKCGFSFSVPERKTRPEERLIRVYGKNLYRFLEQYIRHGAGNKNLPKFVFSWPKAARQALLDAMILGDGSVGQQPGQTIKAYYTTSQQLADDTQILAMSLGYQAKVKPVSQSEDSWGENIYHVFMSGDGSAENYRVVYSHMLTEEHYEGEIFCYNVPGHLFVTRRNGKPTIQGNSVNKSTADNISQVLKDALKDDTDHFAGQVRLQIFAEFFQEANISLSVQNAVAETKLEFHEIDMDNRIKEENHTMEKFNNNMVNHDEARRSLKLKPMDKTEQKGLHHERFTKDLMNHESKLAKDENDNQTENEKGLHKSQIEVLKAQGELEKTKASAHTTKTNNQKAVLEHKAKHMPTIAKAQALANKGKKSVGNKNRPTNQHGRKTSPKRKSDLETITSVIYDKLLVAYDLWDKQEQAEWNRLSALAIDGSLQDLNEMEENYYTSKVREGSDNLKQVVAGTTNPELLYLLVHSSIAEGQDQDGGQQESPDGASAGAVNEGASGSSDPEPEPGLELSPQESDSDRNAEIE